MNSLIGEKVEQNTSKMADLNASVGSDKLVLEIKKAKEIYCGNASDY